MQRLILFAVAMTLALIGTLVFMAGNQMGWISSDQTRFIGTGCFMFSGLVWCLYGWSVRWGARDGTSENK